MSPGEATRSRPGVIDWVVAALATSLALVIGATPFTVSPTFVGLFRDFGSIEELPAITRLALSGWYGVGSAALLAGVTISAMAPRLGVVARRAMLGSCCALGLLGVGVYLFGVYLPLFELADLVGP
jgi:uncharacterized BrkB/YihY/UPF0761 family membrane protein